MVRRITRFSLEIELRNFGREFLVSVECRLGRSFYGVGCIKIFFRSIGVRLVFYRRLWRFGCDRDMRLCRSYNCYLVDLVDGVRVRFLLVSVCFVYCFGIRRYFFKILESFVERGSEAFYCLLRGLYLSDDFYRNYV